VRALPDAFLFEYAGEEQGSEALAGLARLCEIEVPAQSALPSAVARRRSLDRHAGLRPVDAAHYRLAVIDARFFKEVGFGWGILGHLDPGGRFTVQQQELDDNVWEISSMSVNFTGKILLFKSLSISSRRLSPASSGCPRT